jgi:hypothetical protein
MKSTPRRSILAVLTLWAVALVAVLLLPADSGTFSHLGPLVFVCAVGSAVVLRRTDRR